MFYEKLFKAGIVTIPQYPIDKYKLDLAIISGESKLDIEVDGIMYYECQLESEPRARLILSHLCSFESEPPKHRSSNDPDGRSPHSYLGHRI